MQVPERHDPTGLWPEGELASATEFVRHFGHYAASSRNKPIYIAQHGRVGWALLSAAQMTRLSTTDATAMSPDARFDIMIDSISTIVFIIDREFRITRINVAGRRHFQISDSAMSPGDFRELLSANNRDFIADVCTRVLDSGDSETFEIESARYPGQTLSFQIMPFPNGLAILADVVTQATRIRQATAAAAAAELAIDATDLLGRGRIDVRGSITSANHNLVSLAHSTIDKVMGLRLTALFQPEPQHIIRDAIDDVLNSGRGLSLQAKMLTGNADPMPVTIGLGAERDGGSIIGAAFMILPSNGHSLPCH